MSRLEVLNREPEVGERKIHPLCSVFPDMAPDEYEGLKASIKVNGLLHPIVTYEKAILDGKNRDRACRELGVEPRTEPYQGDDLFGFVVAKNLARRSLTTSQRSVIAAKIADMRQGERTDLEPSAKLQKVSQSQAAKKLNVSTRSVADAKHVLEHGAPDLVSAVESGAMKVSAAKAIADLPPEEQQLIVKEKDPGVRRATIKGVKKSAAATKKKIAKALPEIEPHETTRETLYLTNLIGHLTETIPEIKSTVKTRRPVDRELHEQAVKVVEKLREALDTVAPRWRCGECETVLDQGDEPESRYECGECGDGTLKENRCESCNKFATKVSDIACPMESCAGEMVLVGWETVLDLIAAQAKKEEKKDRKWRIELAAAKEFAKTKVGKAEAAKRAAERKAEEAARLKDDEDDTIERARLIAKGRAEGKTTKQVEQDEAKAALAENKARWMAYEAEAAQEAVEVAAGTLEARS